MNGEVAKRYGPFSVDLKHFIRNVVQNKQSTYENYGIIFALLIKSKAVKYPSTVSLVSVNPISCALLRLYSRPKTAMPIIIVKNVKSVPSSAPSFKPCFATHAAHSARCVCMYTSILKGSLDASLSVGPVPTRPK